MRSYCALYIDVGYLLASAATRVSGTSLRRGVEVDHEKLISALIAQAEADSGLPLLRVNWYDSGARPGGMPDYHQEQIGLLPRVKLRLGRLSPMSQEQKGVDLRIGLDLATHGRNRMVDVIYLVSGDDDLTEAVEEAQGHGVQVIVMAVPNHVGRPHAVARHLQREADGVILIEPESIDSTVRSLALPEGLLPAQHPSEAESEESKATPSAPHPPSPADLAHAGQPGPASEPPAAPAGPAPITPQVMARKRPTIVIPPRAPESTRAWSTASGSAAAGDEHGDITPELIDTVVRQVVTSWCASATPDALVELRHGRPFIPNDLDRTMLVDLSSRSGADDIADADRHALRDRFWTLIDQVKVS